MIKKYVKQYDNGLKHLHFHVPFLKTMTMSFYVRAGATSEDAPELLGISHFLEHMVFNGSTKSPEKGQADKVLAVNGIDVNAWTSKNLTNYYHILPFEVIETSFEILFDMVFNPLLRSEDIEKEKGIVLEEIRMYKNDPLTVLDLKIDERTFADTTYTHSILGTEESIKNLTEELVQSYHKMYYSPNNAYFITYGGVEFDKVKDLFSEQLSSLKSQDIRPYNSINKGTGDTTTDPINMEMDTTSSYYLFNILQPKIESLEQYVSYLILQNYMSGGSGALFNEKLILNESLVSDFAFRNASFRDLAVSSFSASTSEKNLEKVREIFIKEFGKTVKGDVNSEDFERARNYLLGGYTRSVETTRYTNSSSMGNVAVMDFILGLEWEIEEVMSMIKNVNKEDVLADWRMLNVEGYVDGFMRPIKKS